MDFLEQLFPRYRSPECNAAWAALKERLQIGDAVSGTVVAKSAYGVWLDVGQGFPALLLIPDVAGLTRERYEADDWCSIGSKLIAEIAVLNDSDHAIRVSQGVPHERRPVV